MQINHRMHQNADVLDLIGQFTFVGRKEFTGALEKLVAKKSPHVIFNFAQVTFVDSAAIGLLAIAAQQGKTNNCKLSVVGAQGAVKQVLALAHIDQLIPTFPDLDAVLSKKAA